MKIWSKLWDWNNPWPVAVILLFYVLIILFILSIIPSSVQIKHLIAYFFAAFIVGVKYTQKTKTIMSNEVKLKVLLCYFLVSLSVLPFYLLLFFTGMLFRGMNIDILGIVVRSTILPALEIYLGLFFGCFYKKIYTSKNNYSYKRNTDGTFSRNSNKSSF